ncbi:MAG: TonB-dependent receptor [Cytophagaceae bacterium]
MTNKIFFIFFISLLFITSLSQAQNYKLSGYVKDAGFDFELSGAFIEITNLKKGIYADDNGYFEISLPSDTLHIKVEYLGYKTFQKTIYLNKDYVLNINLEEEGIELEEVEIKGNKVNENILTTQMSVVRITPKEAALLPAFFGEVDLLKTLQLKPGIQSGGEGTTGLYVRGGGPDQNLFLLDNAIVYNPNHLFGFFSVFNPDAVRNIDLYKGDFPANYGGRLSSVVDVTLREGDKNSFKGSGGLGLISSRLTLEGPIVEDKLSFIISGRRTYFDLITNQINRWQEGQPNFSPIPAYFFYDLNGKISWNVTKKDKITLTGYLGRDQFGYTSRNTNFDFDWGNTVSALTWSHYYNENVSSDVTLFYSDYQYNIENRFRTFSFNLGSGIKNYGAKIDYNHKISPRHTIKYGGQALLHDFEIGRFQAGTNNGGVSLGAGTDLGSSEYGIYITDDFIYSTRLRFNTGLRVSGFYNQGQFYSGLEPRISGRYLVQDNISIKASYARMYQYLHLASNSGATLPTDIWYPSTTLTRPQKSDQLAAGISIDLKDNKYSLTNEVYYKWMDRQIDFKDGANLFVNDELENEFVYGRGWSYGNEIYLEKKSGRTTGWIGYTLSWTWRQFDEINDGIKFPARYDRRHDISVVAMHKLSKRVTLTGTWIYGTGNAVTLPIGRMVLFDIPPGQATVVPVYGDRNSFRMPAYHRMDIGLVWKFFRKWGESDLTFSVYNVYNRRNPYFLYFDEEVNANQQSSRFVGKQVSLFPLIPSVTYNFRF